MNELAMTQARTEMLDNVRRGAVVYDGGSGLWSVDGESVAGWAGRTLSALRRNGYIELGGDAGERSGNSLYTVDLTDRGKEALA